MDLGKIVDRPDLIVAVDFGQTCTGVAYSLAQGGDQIRQIQRWPGVAHRNENKVPTILVYPKGSERPSLWGFKAEGQEDRDDCDVREWYKTLLDPSHLERQRRNNSLDSTSHEDVKKWYVDFLSSLYEYIKQILSAELPNFAFNDAKVEFLFSMPTTWAPDVVDMFRQLICQAGFEGGHKSRHTVTMSLTEAEAAAVFTSTVAAGIFERGDLLVVCDVGGGTTDVSTLEVTETMVDLLTLNQLRQVLVVAGENIGSVAIDIEFEKVVLDRLRFADEQDPLNIDIVQAAWEMQKSKDFQNVKCEHGAPYETPQFVIAIPGLKPGYINRKARIADGHMHFDKSDLQEVFDKQVNKLFRLVDKQLRALADRLPDKQVKHLVLSGGLGQSPYVQQRLKNHYCNSDHLPNTEGIQVRVAPEPQMAVCKGLVADRLRKLKAGQSVLGWRCCRASYGLLCKELYDKKNPKHVGRELSKDPADGQLYVVHCVDWLIKKGEPVTIDEPVIHAFVRKVKPGDPRKIFPSKVVVSYAERDALPSKLETGVEQLCVVEADLSLADERKFVAKNKKFWQSGESFLIVKYEVRVIIGPADLLFELWFEDQKMSNEQAIKVDWAPSTAPSTAALQPVEKFDDDSLRTHEQGKKIARHGFFSRNKVKST